MRGWGETEVWVPSGFLTGFLFLFFAWFHRDPRFPHRFHHRPFRDAPAREVKRIGEKRKEERVSMGMKEMDYDGNYHAMRSNQRKHCDAKYLQ